MNILTPFKALANAVGLGDQQLTFQLPPKPVEDRSSKWPAVEKAHLKSEPVCQVCGTNHDLEVHHIVAFHVDPTKELDDTNLITLCRPHHYTFGHFCNWKSWNQTCREDCTEWRVKIARRPKL